jgi:hypothetical protein
MFDCLQKPHKTLTKTKLKSLPLATQNTDTPKGPTLKQLFSKENLTTYIEAAQTKNLNCIFGGEK